MFEPCGAPATLSFNPQDPDIMRIGLYQKLFLWLLLNLVLLGLLAVALFGGVLIRGSNGLLPTYLFSSKVENVFRTISAHCQYKPADQWADILLQYSQDNKLFYTLYSLEKGFYPVGTPTIPVEVAETAKGMPRYPFTLCPDPSIVLPPYAPVSDGVGAPQYIDETAKHYAKSMEAGIPPSPRVLFMRAGEPARYWLARALFIPDENHHLHYVLLAASSDSLSGHGLFFDIDLMLAVLGGGLVASCLWWWPFVRHMSKPLLKMTAVSEKLATYEAGAFLSSPLDANICGVDPRRSDEIGRLAQSINVTAQHLYGTLFRQRQFISHIAHEINSPLARIQLGLAVMEDRMEGEARERVKKIISEVDLLSVLTGDILNFLRAESEHQTPVFEKVDLYSFIAKLIDAEAAEGNVSLSIESELTVSSSTRYLRRALANILRNSLKYAGKDLPIEVLVFEQGQHVRIDILDRGPGVPKEDLPLLANPFFRSSARYSGESGAGLGLSIVKYCIEACKGTVSFANRKPSGFVVSILLPREP